MNNVLPSRQCCDYHRSAGPAENSCGGDSYLGVTFTHLHDDEIRCSAPEVTGVRISISFGTHEAEAEVQIGPEEDPLVVAARLSARLARMSLEGAVR